MSSLASAVCICGVAAACRIVVSCEVNNGTFNALRKAIFRSTGKGWQTRLDEALKEYVEAQQQG